MTREVAGLKRKLANMRMEENRDDLENCKVDLEEDFSHSTDLTLGLNLLETTGTNSKNINNNLSEPLPHDRGLRYNEDDLVNLCLQFPFEATPILLANGQLDVHSLHSLAAASLAHSSTLRLSSGYWSPEMRNLVTPCDQNDLCHHQASS